MDSPDGQESAEPLPDDTLTSRHTHNRGGLRYWFSEGWRHLRPFLPFLLISGLVIMLVCLLQKIVYGGPFTDPLFFAKFEKRWPLPPHLRPGGGASGEGDQVEVVELTTLPPLPTQTPGTGGE